MATTHPLFFTFTLQFDDSGVDTRITFSRYTIQQPANEKQDVP